MKKGKFMITRDPWNGRQINFERTDPTGRYSPITNEDDESFVMYVLAGFMVSLFAGGIAIIFLMGI